MCSGSVEGREISVGVADGSVGVEMEGDGVDGSDGAEIRIVEVDFSESRTRVNGSKDVVDKRVCKPSSEWPSPCSYAAREWRGGDYG
jgi:hypothetical protein